MRQLPQGGFQRLSRHLLANPFNRAAALDELRSQAVVLQDLEGQAPFRRNVWVLRQIQRLSLQRQVIEVPARDRLRDLPPDEILDVLRLPLLHPAHSSSERFSVQ